MRNEIVSKHFYEGVNPYKELPSMENSAYPEFTLLKSELNSLSDLANDPAEILFVTSYPPRECGIATYSQDLIQALNNKFNHSLSIKVCALESNRTTYPYPEEVRYTLKTSLANEYKKLAFKINRDERIKIVLIQHEFGLYKKQEQAFLQFLYELSHPIVTVFHTVLPHPDERLKLIVAGISNACTSLIVMTRISADILMNDYDVPPHKISVIAHGTHLVPHLSKTILKAKYGLQDRKVLTTFGLLSAGKGIETTLEAMPAIIKSNPDVLFLVIGKTHPEVVKSDGEKYRKMLQQKVKQYALDDHVVFINNFVPLPELLDYLQLTDIYLFTAIDPNQAVSGTFVYAMSCACPIISTPIPHVREYLTEDTGIIIDFGNSHQLANGVTRLLSDEALRKNISSNTLEKIVSTTWDNSAVAHAMVFEKLASEKISLRYNLPAINLNHLKHMTTDTGIIQFSRINEPDITSGYTLDDNARALVATCMCFKADANEESLFFIKKYMSFIKQCQQPAGNFINYMDRNNKFTDQNNKVNLDDANGRAVWALGYAVSLLGQLPDESITEAEIVLEKSLVRVKKMNSSRAMAFAIKGLYYYNGTKQSSNNLVLIKTFANRLVQMFKHESSINWMWFESYLTYANSILPEAMLYAWMVTRETIYKDIARSSLDFLLSHIFNENGIEVISNKKWLYKGKDAGQFGEQPIDVAYTILTLSKFYDEFKDEDYRLKMETAFNWFLGDNRLHQIVYNPCTGGCYDGLEENHVNINQGAESTLSYLMARLTMEKYKDLGI